MFSSYTSSSSSLAHPVMLWLTRVTLEYKRHYLVFTCDLTAEPLGILPLPPPPFSTLSQRSSHTCRHLCYCPVLTQLPVPVPIRCSLIRFSTPLPSVPVAMSQHRPLFSLTTQLGPDNDRKGTIISITVGA